MTTPAQATPSGIAGEVVLWPLAPVERPGMVNHRPCQATLRITDAAGHTVARVRSDAAGRFEVRLAPGVYRLHPEPVTALSRAREQTVAVAPGRFTPVRIAYDSGKR